LRAFAKSLLAQEHVTVPARGEDLRVLAAVLDRPLDEGVLAGRRRLQVEAVGGGDVGACQARQCGAGEHGRRADHETASLQVSLPKPVLPVF